MIRTSTRPRVSGRRGFALPFTIFLVTFITLMLAFAFSRTAVEMEIAQSSGASVTALTVAQGGLNAFLADTFTLRPTPGDSFRYNLSGGYAWVVPQEIQKPADTVGANIIYAVRSNGYVIEPTQGATPQAQRTVVQFAQWYYPRSAPAVPALYSAINGIVRSGASAQFTVFSTDQCASGEPPLAQLLTQNPVPAITSGSGSAPISHDTAAVLATMVNVNWADVVAGNFAADHNSIQLNDTTYSTQLVNGDATLSMPDSGTGLLIVTGNLYITGSGGSSADVDWNGIILVGGQAIVSAQFFDMNGLIVTGLNAPYSPPPTPPVPKDTLKGQDADFYYNPCHVEKALGNLRGFVGFPNTFVDNWATY